MESVNDLIGMCLGSIMFAFFVMVLGGNLTTVFQKIMKELL